MWFPRVKIRLTNNMINKYYKTNEWIYLTKFKTKKLYFKYRSDNVIEFAIDGYKNRKTALKVGKILFSNILFNGYKSFLNFEMGDRFYITKWYNVKSDYTKEEWEKNEEWFFDTKSDSPDFLGFSIYEASNIDNLGFYEKNLGIEMNAIIDENIDIIEKVKSIDYECVYTETAQKIYHMFNIIENADTCTQILLLCQVLEIMGINSNKSDKAILLIDELKKIVDNNKEINGKEKSSIKSGLENIKHEASWKKIDSLLKKYYKKYNITTRKKIRDFYDKRSRIIHGDVYGEIDDFFVGIREVKNIVLETFKEWQKTNK